MAESNCSLKRAHFHSNRQGQARLILALLLCATFMILELVAGHLSGSLAIITDAVHLLSDVASLLISILAIVWARKPPTSKYTFGFYRAEILGALMSIFLIWLMAAFLLVEAFERFSSPRPVDSSVMMVTAIIGVLVNILIGTILYDRHSHSILPSSDHFHEHHAHHHNLNMRAAFLHVLGDLLQSVGVVIASVIIKWKPEWTFVDPICTFFFTAIVIFSTGYMLKDIMDVLMEATPDTIDLEEIQRTLLSIRGVQRVSDIHVWALLPGTNCSAVKLLIEPSIDHASVLNQARSALRTLNSIQHSTIEIESI